MLRGIVHRDIKPSNLLLDTEGVVWIADFGLAKMEDDGLTQSGDIVGTLRYMAPERFRGEGDAGGDVYALGLTLYELLTLRPAFNSPDRLKLIEQIKAEEPEKPRAIDAMIPRDLETIVLKAIEKDPKARYRSAEAMGEDLGRFLADEPIQARQQTVIERYARWARHHPTVAVLGGVLAAFLVLVTIGSLLAMGRFASLADRERKAARAERLAHEEASRRAKAESLARGEAERARTQAEKAESEATEQRKRADQRGRSRPAKSLLRADEPGAAGVAGAHRLAATCANSSPTGSPRASRPTAAAGSGSTSTHSFTGPSERSRRSGPVIDTARWHGTSPAIDSPPARTTA